MKPFGYIAFSQDFGICLDLKESRGERGGSTWRVRRSNAGRRRRETVRGRWPRERGDQARTESRQPRMEGARGASQRLGVPPRGLAALSSSRPAAGALRLQRALMDPPRHQPGRVSRIFHRGKPTGGVGVRPRPPPLEAAGWGGMVYRGSKGLTILLGGQRLARAEESVGAQTGPAGSGGGPAALGWGGCGPQDARGGGGAGWGRGSGATGPAPAG